MPRPGAALREQMAAGTVLLPGVFSPLSALAAAKMGASALYISGGATTNELLGVPDIALIGLEELAGVARRITQVVQVPVISDADTGFGDGWNVARTVIEMEQAGLAGIHLEDQVSPKRCGHLAGKDVIEADRMAAKIRAAVDARQDDSFLIIARTDARAIEGVQGAADRANRYLEAGADVIFPEGLRSEEEFAEIRAKVKAPLLANMTEFGQTPLISAARFQELGYEMVIFPVTALRVMLRAIEEFYGDLLATGTQAGWMDKMRTRAELYDTLEYPAYTAQDEAWGESNTKAPA